MPGARITSDFLRGTWRGGWCALRRATLAVWRGTRTGLRHVRRPADTALISILATILTIVTARAVVACGLDLQVHQILSATRTDPIRVDG